MADAINKLPGKLVAIVSPLCKALRSQFHTVLYQVRHLNPVECAFFFVSIDTTGCPCS